MKFLVVLLLSMRLAACGSSSSGGGNAQLIGATSLGACSDSNQGQVGYDTADKTLRVCDAGEWTIIQYPSSLLVKDFNGRSIGTLIRSDFRPSPDSSDAIEVNVGSGYVLSVSMSTGKSAAGCYYASTNCSGPCLAYSRYKEGQTRLLADKDSNLLTASDTKTSGEVKSTYIPSKSECATVTPSTQDFYTTTEYIPSSFVYPITAPLTVEPSL